MTALFIVQLLLVVVLFARAWRDYATAPRLARAGDDHPRLAVLVPARNEAHNIGPCLAALRASERVDLEIVVIDDASTDATATIVDDVASRDARVTLVHAPPRPDGWCGKSWALAQGVAGVDPGIDQLCFVDADVRLAPETLARAVTYARDHDAAMVSLLPTLITETFWESVVQPVMGMMMFVFQPLGEVNDPAAELAVANGQFLWVDRRAYERLGGHATVRGEIVEDVALARTFKAAGERVALVLAPEGMRTRMYDSLVSLWRGWGKTIHPYLQREPGRIWLGVLVFATLLWLPVATLGLVALGAGAVPFAVNLTTVVTILANVLLFRAKMHQPLRHGLLWPLAIAVLVALFAWRTLGTWAGWAVTWKQRTYA